MINVPEHVGGGVLGEQVEQEPVADVAAAEKIVGEAHVLRGEVTEPKSVISAKKSRSRRALSRPRSGCATDEIHPK